MSKEWIENSIENEKTQLYAMTTVELFHRHIAVFNQAPRAIEREAIIAKILIETRRVLEEQERSAEA